MGKQWKQKETWFGGGSKIIADGDCSHEMKRHLFLERKVMTKLEKMKNNSQSYGFSSSNVWMWDLDHTESGALKIWCFWTDVLEKNLESPFNCKEIKSLNPKGNQPWIFITRTDAETEALILWPPDKKSQLTGKAPETGKDEGRRRRGRQWMRWLDGKKDSMDLSLNKLWEMMIRKPGVLQSMGRKELDMTERLNNKM